MTVPSISVVVPAYNAERHIAETLEAILAQTHAPDEVIVVDDGSSDGTPAELRRFGNAIRVVRQVNRGAGGAHNTGFGQARGDFVARCDADDIWEPCKLERQLDALRTHPEIDIAFSGARVFGLANGPYGESPGEGVLDSGRFWRTLYRANLVCASSIIMRRRLFDALGPFEASLVCEDYEFLLRAVAAGATFYHDPGELVRYRRHGSQVTHDRLRMTRATYLVHRRGALAPDDQRLVATVLAGDLSRIARLLVDEDRADEARGAFVQGLRLRPTPHALAWALLLSAPRGAGLALADRLLPLKRACTPAP